MTGEKCIKCTDRYPGCQDHCQYGQEAKAERERVRTAKAKAISTEAANYYASKKYRR